MKLIENTDITYSNNALLLTLHNVPCASWKLQAIRCKQTPKGNILI
jgi:hypothetical protein